jgi:hypothetical protein
LPVEPIYETQPEPQPELMEITSTHCEASPFPPAHRPPALDLPRTPDPGPRPLTPGP